jgi:hypothetical protein
MTAKFKEHVKYKIQPQRDGSYVILQKNMNNKHVDIHSSHDTFEEAKDELDSLYSKPSQADTMKFLNDLRFSMDSIK